jgi:hypothetical protein
LRVYSDPFGKLEGVFFRDIINSHYDLALLLAFSRYFFSSPCIS